MPGADVDYRPRCLRCLLGLHPQRIHHRLAIGAGDNHRIELLFDRVRSDFAPALIASGPRRQRIGFLGRVQSSLHPQQLLQPAERSAATHECARIKLRIRRRWPHAARAEPLCLAADQLFVDCLLLLRFLRRRLLCKCLLHLHRQHRILQRPPLAVIFFALRRAHSLLVAAKARRKTLHASAAAAQKLLCQRKRGRRLRVVPAAADDVAEHASSPVEEPQ